MSEDQIRALIQQMIDQNAVKAQYSVTKVPFHTHNGIDSPPLGLTSSSSQVAGNNQQIQYNNNGKFGAIPNAIYNKTTGLVVIQGDNVTNSAVQNGTVEILGGNAVGDNGAGSAALQGGNGDTGAHNGGDVQIASGGPGASGIGGQINIFTSGGVNGNSGPLSISTGSGDGAGNGGLIRITGGNGGTTGNGADIDITAGTKGASGTNNGKIVLGSGWSSTSQSYTPTAAGTATLDLGLANEHRITMPAGNITIALTNPTDAQKFLVSITQDSGGSRTVTWFTTIKWAGGVAPTLTTTANKRDTFGFVRTGSGTYDGFVIGQNV